MGKLSKYWKDYIKSIYGDDYDDEGILDEVAAKMGLTHQKLIEDILSDALMEADKSIEANSVRGAPNYYCYGPRAKALMEGEPYEGNIVTELRANADGTVTVTETDITDGYQEISTY